MFEVAQIVLLIPHSNAAIKRLLSLVNKNKTESSDRNRLDQDKALSSILAVKLDHPDTSSALYLNSYTKQRCSKYKLLLRSSDISA